MANLDLSILVVDDAKFSSMVVSRTLSKAGYRDVRIANNARAALEMMESRPASLLIADWLMPETDGLALTDQIRQIDEQRNHYTYVVLLTAKESVAALAEAFDRGVDDFIYKSDMSKQLLPRVFAADRLADRQNALLSANALLVENNRDLEGRNFIDLQTGLSNIRYARRRLEECLRQTEARGGATAYVLIGIRNWASIRQQYRPTIINELAVGVGRRLTHLIRPMDMLARVGENEFAVVAYFNNAELCTPQAFRRILDGVNHKAFKTTAGFISIEADIVLCQSNAEMGTPSVNEVERASVEGLRLAYETRRFEEVTPDIN